MASVGLLASDTTPFPYGDSTRVEFGSPFFWILLAASTLTKRIAVVERNWTSLPKVEFVDRALGLLYLQSAPPRIRAVVSLCGRKLHLACSGGYSLDELFENSDVQRTRCWRLGMELATNHEPIVEIGRAHV